MFYKNTGFFEYPRRIQMASAGGRGGAIMKLKKEHIAFLNETARIDFDSALQTVDGVNMLSDVEYGFVHMNDGEYRLVYWEDGILKDAYKNCEG